MKTTTKKHTFGNLADELSGELYAIKSTLELCSFAAEARRVLSEIDDFLKFNSEIEKALHDRIESHNDWVCHRDSLSEVLKNIARQVDAVHDRLNDPEVHRDINNP